MFLCCHHDMDIFPEQLPHSQTCIFTFELLIDLNHIPACGRCYVQNAPSHFKRTKSNKKRNVEE